MGLAGYDSRLYSTHSMRSGFGTGLQIAFNNYNEAIKKGLLNSMVYKQYAKEENISKKENLGKAILDSGN